MTARRRVCITGIGIVSPLGNCRESSWHNVVAGRSAAGPITRFDASTWPTQFACEVSQEFSLEEDALLPQHLPILNHAAQFGVMAAKEAMADAAFEVPLPPERLGVCMGAGIGAIQPLQLATILSSMGKLNPEQQARCAQLAEEEMKGLLLRNHPATLGSILAARWGAQGPVNTIHTACASSGQSLGQALMHVRRGDADVILAGGADSLASELLLAGFCLLGALSTRNDDPQGASRPFDKDRDGFVAGEGAAMLIVEEKDHALRRGAKIYCEFAGYGETESAYRITDLPENGRGCVEAMHGAVLDGGIDHGEVDYINAHGTSTELNDRVEALSVRRVFGARGVNPFVSSTKSEIGHLISAAGAMEAAFCALAIRDGAVPPTRNLSRTDCGEDINFVAGESRKFPVRAALSNSIGFGGSNSVVALKRDI